jgi:hypothetical protein
MSCGKTLKKGLLVDIIYKLCVILAERGRIQQLNSTIEKFIF